jgi:hypothetical protein
MGASMELFDEVTEALRGLLPGELGPLRHRTHRYGTKVWFGPEQPPKEHYEAQVIGADHVVDAEVLAVEVGFHAEHPQAEANDAVLAALADQEAAWRPALGPDAEAGPFLGRASWRRLSETWPDPDLGDPELAVELALRLLDYVTALEPVRRSEDTASATSR